MCFIDLTVFLFTDEDTQESKKEEEKWYGCIINGSICSINLIFLYVVFYT